MVSRQRLHKKLDHSLECRLTTVIAPAGYGKTTAILDWLANCSHPSAWLSVDANDNNPVFFWRYCCAALEEIVPDISESTEYVFSSQELLQANIHINIMIDRISEAETEFILVLDDLYYINNPTVLEGLSFLIAYLPENTHLILISRTEPELNLASQKIKWQIQQLDARDLRFQSDEIHQFYEARGLDLENSDLKIVEEYTEGWAASLVAIALHMDKFAGSRILLERFGSIGYDIDRYLKKEVVSSWTAEKLTFFLKTSILGTFCASLCDAVTEAGNGSRILQEIHEENGFLIPLDDRQYRYHHLFRNCLYQILTERDPSDISNLHIKAARWYRENGLLFEAIEHFLSGYSYEEALSLMEYRIEELINQNDYITLFSWIERLPESYRFTNFKIAAVYAAYYAEISRFELSREWISRMETLMAEERYVSDPEFIGYARAVCSLSRANVLLREGALIELADLLATVTEQNSDKYYKISKYIDFNTADIYFLRCPIKNLASLFGKLSDKFSDVTGNFRKMISINPGYAPLAVGEHLYEINSLQEAFPYLLEAMEEARAAECPGAFVPAMADLARVKAAKEDFKGAFEALDQCEEWLQNVGKPHWNYPLNALRCRLSLESGDLTEAERWFDSCKLDIYTVAGRSREFELFVYSRILIYKGRLHDAELLLQRLLTYADSMDRLHSKVEILNLFAILAYKKGDLQEAVIWLEKSLIAGMEEGYIRSYMDEHDPMIKLLKYYTECRGRRKDHSASEAAAYAESVLSRMIDRRMAADPFNEAVFEGRVKLLTAQEKKILDLLLEAKTNEEICKKLGIKMCTVKTHTRNIYSKLGVKNRIQCIKLAHEIDTLD